jgi:hypothetical protein
VKVNAWTKVEVARFTDTESALRCPRCGEPGGLHHGQVTIYDRLREDSEETTVTRVWNGMVSSHRMTGPVGNPSDRRGGLRVSFSCEFCGDRVELTLAQHKGDTVIGWCFTEEVEEEVEDD